jgi:hypothetical protein
MMINDESRKWSLRLLILLAIVLVIILKPPYLSDD